ncbi:Patched domain-containing protein 3 [Aphelenchoides fujianensis]|nr:Patched domain-containing protein 3 [Aphelenchoides fujianensis]
MRKVGYLVGEHPIKLLVFTFALLLPLASFFLLYPIDIDTDVRRGFAHRNGRSTREFRAFADFHAIDIHDLELFIVLIESKDEGHSNLQMSKRLLDEVERLNTNITTMSSPMANGSTLTFKQLETTGGSINTLFHAFKFGYDWQADLLASNSSLSDDIRLDFPNSNIFGHNVTTFSHFFGVKRFDEYLDSKWRPSQIKEVNTIALWYMLSANPAQRRALQQMELEVFEASRSNFSDEFTFFVYGDLIANTEMMKGSEQTSKLLVFQMRDFPLRSAILLTAACIGSPLLAIVAAFGLMGWLGMPFNSLMSISPFLVIGIGVDDAFLLLHSWRKHVKKGGSAAAVSEAVVSDVGPSVSITSITNILAFSIGVFSPANQMSGFCLATTLAVAFDFVGVQTLSTGQTRVWFFKKKPPFLGKIFSFPTRDFSLFAPCLALCGSTDGQKAKAVVRDENEHTEWSRYAHFLLSWWGKAGCFVVLVGLVLFNSFGIQQMETTFNPQKTFPLNSHLQQSLRPIDRLIVEYAPLSFVVNKPPAISQVPEFLAMVEEIESLPGTYGDNTTHLWLRDFLRYDQRKHQKSNSSAAYTPSYQRTPDFLVDRMMADKNVVKWHKEGDRVVLDSFVFVIVRYGKRSWHERADIIEQLRNLIDRYPQFEVSAFDYDSTIFDLIITVKSEMLKAVLITLACMTVVCFVIVPSAHFTLLAAMAVLSISFNLLGLLGWWNQDLDPVTMINVVVAIGFSVDFVAHIVFHVWSTEREERRLGLADPKRRAAEERPPAAGHLAGPSTAIIVLPLFLLDIYVVVAFAKTVVLVCGARLLDSSKPLLLLRSSSSTHKTLPSRKGCLKSVM